MRLLLLVVTAITIITPEAVLAAEEALAPAADVPGADIVAGLLEYLPASLAGWATAIIAACAVIASAWPRPSADAHVLWRLLYTLVNALAANFGRAKNASDVTTGKPQ